MIELSRRIRFCIPLNDQGLDALSTPRTNTFAAWPGPWGLAAYYELEVACRGEPDPLTGYLHSIADVDRAVREHVLPELQTVVRREPERAPETLMPAILTALQGPLRGSVHSVTWHLTPYHALTLEHASMSTILLRESFSFAASHRLHCPELDPEANRRIFGKCNNENGHGHNYRVEVAIEATLDDSKPIDRPAFSAAVDEHVISRFDHTHLNRDTVEFQTIMPSVEHIARTCYDLLVEPIAALGARVHSVRVWETDKTSCEYPVTA